MAVVRHKEAIHSGHFMISNFEAEEQDDEENIAVPVPDEGTIAVLPPEISTEEVVNNTFQPLVSFLNSSAVPVANTNNLIDVSLNKLFQCMSIAYRQKLTSPKWNRFRGMKLRWKDKIRLNNVIWRCWHMQFIKGHRKCVCAFGNPLEIDNHNKTEAGAILEGKYWKRKLATVTAEYKRWRIFYKQQHENQFNLQPITSDHFMDITNNLYQYGTKDDVDLESMITDADFFVDALFNSLGSHQRDHPRCLDGMPCNSDIIQPDLSMHFHPNLDELMDLDPIAPLQDWLSTRLPEVENSSSTRGKSLTPEQDLLSLPMPDIKDIVMDTNFPIQTYTQPKLLDHHRQRSFSTSSVAAPVVVMSSDRNRTDSNKHAIKDDFYSKASSTSISCEPSTSKLENNFTLAKREPARKPINGFSRGKLWSAAVRQAQEMELLESNRAFPDQSKPLSSLSAPAVTSCSGLLHIRDKGQHQSVLRNQSHLSSQQQQLSGQQPQLSIQHQSQLYDQQKRTRDQQGMSDQQEVDQQLQLRAVLGYQEQQVLREQQALEEQQEIRQQALRDQQMIRQQQLNRQQEMNRQQQINLQQQINRQQSTIIENQVKNQQIFMMPKEMMGMNQSNIRNQEGLISVIREPPAKVMRLEQESPFVASEYMRRPEPLEDSSILNLKIQREFMCPQSQKFEFEKADKSRVSSDPTIYGGTSTLSGAPGGGGGGGDRGDNMVIRGNFRELKEQEAQETGRKKENSQLLQLLQENRYDQSIRVKTETQGSRYEVQRTTTRNFSNESLEIKPKVGEREGFPSKNTQLKRKGKIPPPPPGSHPQPSYTIGSSIPNPGIADDLKVSVAEQKRRCTIKNGFDFLRTLVPSLAQNPNLKISKAALLVKGGEYLTQLKSEREALDQEISCLRSSVETLTEEIARFQAQLPTQGSAPKTTVLNRKSELQSMFDHHVAVCTVQNWKYWVFSKMMQPLLETFDKTVSSSSFEDMCRTTNSWLDQHASLVQLRPLVIHTLKDLSITTDILSEPHRMPQEALSAISQELYLKPETSSSFSRNTSSSTRETRTRDANSRNSSNREEPEYIL